MKKIALSILVLILMSCDRTDETLPSDVFEVTTRGISIDCKLVIIEFKESDRERIERLTDRPGLHYEALNLDANSVEAENQQLRVAVRKILDSENIICTHWGISLPLITVLNVTSIN